jgi:hypothetical protein
MVEDAAVRERIAALEVQVKHLTAVVERQDQKIDVLVETLQQAKGAKWVLFALVGIGGFIAGKLPTLAGYLGLVGKGN